MVTIVAGIWVKAAEKVAIQKGEVDGVHQNFLTATKIQAKTPTRVPRQTKTTQSNFLQALGSTEIP